MDLNRLLTLVAVLFPFVSGANVADFYPYGASMDQNITGNDTRTSEKLTMDVPIVYYSQRRFSVWVSK